MEITMRKDKVPGGSACPVARAADLVGDRWSLLIIRDAFDGVRRFGDFRDSLGVSSNILTQRLKMLVDEGILEIVPASDGTAYQEYRLTKKGQEFFPVVVTLRQWGEAHLFRRGEKHSVLVERDTGKAVKKVNLMRGDGRSLKASETVVRKFTSESDKT
jgi:DNA-binding HxlR family transcriptional regulator